MSPSDPPSSKPGPGRRPAWPKLAWALAVIVAGAWGVRHFQLLPRIPEALAWFRSLGPWGAVAFVVAYVLACVLFLPGSVLTLGAGALFGVPLGFAVVSLASTLGATVCFLIGRLVARDWIAGQAAKNPRFAALDAAVGREGRKIVGLLRLSPVVPFGLLNYGLGVTRVRLGDFVLASWLGMMPGTLLYVWLGALAGDAAKMAHGQRQRTSVEWAFYGVGLLATLAVTAYVTRVAKRALNERLDSAPKNP